MRRKTHEGLQGAFRERWQMLAAMVSDKFAEEVRTTIYCHTLMNRHHLRHIFGRDSAHRVEHHRQMERFERLHGFGFAENDTKWPVRNAAFPFHCPSVHMDEGPEVNAQLGSSRIWRWNKLWLAMVLRMF